MLKKRDKGNIMDNNDIHEGGCSCGSARYKTIGYPIRHAVCHCRYCQLRTGAPFGMGAYFDNKNVAIISGEFTNFHYTTISGSEVKTSFCIKCGTTTHWEIYSELFTGTTAIAVGTYDPPSFWFKVEREVFLRSKAQFVNNDIKDKFETSITYKPKGKDSVSKTPILK